MNSTSSRLGLVGLGLMGRGIGHSLLRAGHRLGIVAHRRREVADELLAAGAWEASSPRELAAACDALVLCVSSAEASRQCLVGERGVLESGRAGLLVIESSTLMPEAAREFAGALRTAGIDFVDAPVTRGPREAMEGRLNALVGGEPQAVERALGVLAGYCERSFVMGGAGSGYAAKLVNNFLAFNNLVAVAEAMTTAVKAGLALPTLLEAIAASGGQNRVLDGLAPWLATGGETRSRVTIDTARKDAQYFHAFARSLGTGGGASGHVLQALAQAVEHGLGEAFTPAYLEHVAAAAGVDLQQGRRTQG
jgi:3-hydroxyisobutyrate dehydrogenase-like beta-hydroxyacid dehydrogenase